MKTQQSFKKLSLKKTDVVNLDREMLSNAKGGIVPVAGFSDLADTCVMGTLQLTCTRQINCTYGPECDMGIWPE